ncbi:ATP-dependent RNA helicase HrpA [Aurantimicrobium minutum]|uniref:ATP-dependent RNA helicase HrpA n=1 Tax=Aurantimicrobium minutum TaxID=708131 RepID=UPI00247574A9|nr:ATP-dependent RNA helicase HrpA [Aurantimicrobium minutum]MDH6423108.1 ATP-dependent helicase HrpA [Aurantimicrobium minutum]
MDAALITYPPDLPVSERREEILKTIRDNQVVIIAGATGSGKTTQIPKMCLELGRTSIAHTQPRRIAARAVAERIAEELKVELGGLVGYQVRFTDQASPETEVKVMTDGILLNALQRDRLLKNYDTIIIDEAHERSLNIDFLLGYLKQILPQRPDLKLIITSATIDPESFSQHFGGAPMIEVSGRTFPIEIRYRPLVEDKMSSDDVDDDELADASNKATQAPEHSARDYLDGIISALNELDKEAPGDVLVFLSGETEIRDAQEAIEGHIAAGRMKSGTEVLPLYGRLSAADQHKVFEPSKVVGLRKRIILATNVAETSLTVPGIKYVIDAGTARISRYSPRAKVQRLPIEAISQASANQRSGRCGRTSDGIAIRLYSEEDFERRPEFTDPEILRTNLASVILQAASLGLGDISQFPFLQTPDSRGVKDGIDLLKELGAIQSNSNTTKLTKIGHDLSRLPIEPRFARMVLESRNHGVTREVMAIVAGLTVQDPRERPLEKRPQADLSHARFTDPTSDFLSLLNLWNYLEEKQKELSSSAFRRMCKAEFLNYLRVREWNDVFRQLKTLTKPLGLSLGEPKIDPDGIHKSLLSGLLSHIGLKQVSDNKLGSKYNEKNSPRKQQHEYLGARNQKFVIFPGSALAKKPPAAVMSAELVETSRLFARTNAAIDPGWAEKIAGELCKRSYSEPHWEKNQGAVVAYERVTLFGVTLVAHRRMQYSRVDTELCRELFIRHALVDGEWDSKQAFDRSNRILRRQLEELEERSRRRDILADDEVVFAFYDQRIPADVFSTRTFEGWWKKERSTNPDFLTMQRSDLLEETEAEHDEIEFPSEWVYGDQRLKLKYRFEPGREDDGVTVEIPLPLLARLEPEAFDWLVPGLRLELITGLIKTLPKNIRRQVVPAADWAAKAAATLPEQPEGNLLVAVAKALQHLSGALVSPQDFDPERLADHLRMTYRVISNTGKNLGTDKNLSKLQRGLAERSRDAVAEVAERVTSPLERDGLTSWDFDELPRTVDAKHGGNTVRAYPALVVENPGTARQEVNIRLLATEADQRREHPLGTRALVVAAIPSPAKYVQEHLTAAEKLILTQSPYPSLNALISDAIAASVDNVLFSMREDGMIFQKAEFETLRDRVQGAIMDNIFDAVSLTARILSAAKEAQKAMANTNPMSFLAQLSQEKAHLEQLLQPGFISDAGLARLPRILIYVRAITMRINKMVEDSGRDRTAAVELDQALNLYEAAGGKIPLAPHSPDKLVKVRWMLEEFRVSLFAQSLGTAEPISLQRIKKVLA